MRQDFQQQYQVVFTLCINQFPLMNTFSCLFPLTSLLIDSISLSFDLFEHCIALNPLLATFHFVSEFLFLLVLF